MRHFFSLTLLLVFGLTTPTVAQTEVASEAPTDAQQLAIRQNIDSYIQAFNAGDAKQLAAHWTEDGELTTEAGTTYQGRQAMEDAFTEYFAANKGAVIDLLDVQLNIVSPHVAVETGTAQVVVPNQEPELSTYEAVHVKGAAGWKMDSVRETVAAEPPPTHYQQLASLEWMIGEWGDDSEDSTFETSCRWSTNRNFIIRSFRVVVGDHIDFEGTQIIGWDPNLNTIRSWVFDSDGGFGVGRWEQDGNRWTVHTMHNLPDGRMGTAINLYELVDENTVRFESTARQVDGELMPSIDPVDLKRR